MHFSYALFSFFCVLISFSSLFARGEKMTIGTGIGLHFDLGSLQDTLSVSGYDSPATGYQVIIPANELRTLGSNNPAVTVDTSSGFLTGLNLDLNWESYFLKYFFTRLVLQGTVGISGGRASASFRLGQIVSTVEGVLRSELSRQGQATLSDQESKSITLISESIAQSIGAEPTEEFYNSSVDYYTISLPVYFGVKFKIAKKSFLYGAFGFHYIHASSKIKLLNRSQSIYDSSLEKTMNAVNNLPPLVRSDGTDVDIQDIINTILRNSLPGPQEGMSETDVDDTLLFQFNGLGFNALLGLETEIASGHSLYFEVEYLFAGGFNSANVSDPGLRRALGSEGIESFTLSVLTGGMRFKVGYRAGIW